MKWTAKAGYLLWILLQGVIANDFSVTFMIKDVPGILFVVKSKIYVTGIIHGGFNWNLGVFTILIFLTV